MHSAVFEALRALPQVSKASQPAKSLVWTPIWDLFCCFYELGVLFSVFAIAALISTLRPLIVGNSNLAWPVLEMASTCWMVKTRKDRVQTVARKYSKGFPTGS